MQRPPAATDGLFWQSPVVHQKAVPVPNIDVPLHPLQQQPRPPCDPRAPRRTICRDRQKNTINLHNNLPGSAKEMISDVRPMSSSKSSASSCGAASRRAPPSTMRIVSSSTSCGMDELTLGLERKPSLDRICCLIASIRTKLSDSCC